MVFEGREWALMVTSRFRHLGRGSEKKRSTSSVPSQQVGVIYTAAGPLLRNILWNAADAAAFLRFSSRLSYFKRMGY